MTMQFGNNRGITTSYPSLKYLNENFLSYFFYNAFVHLKKSFILVQSANLQIIP